jgi:CO dehydrogenase/acetyl-CoA synthase gamma subunit (corrinoid Fe-S protein)
VDNAVAERMFKAVEVLKAIKENLVEQRLERPVIIIPGLAESERNSIRQITRCTVLVGPVSGFLAPLFIFANREEFL